MNRPIGPCKYPGCKNTDGDPELTTEIMCRRCQRRYQKLLEHLADDWLTLHRDLPQPAVRANVVRATTAKTYGHPAEWASDMAADIADRLNGVHSELANHLNATPAPHPGSPEKSKVRQAWAFLRVRIPALVELDWNGDFAIELNDTHRKVRAGLGHTRARQALPVPCPNCGLKTMFRTADPFNDRITCEACEWHTTEEHYPLLARMAIDTLLAEAEADQPCPAIS